MHDAPPGDGLDTTVFGEGLARVALAGPVVSERLQVMDPFAAGGMGAIHPARDPVLGRVVALKVIGERVAQDELLRLRFLTEAQLTAQLDHPNIVPVYGMEHAGDGTPAFTMKLIRGQTLKDLLTSCVDGDGPDLDERLEVFVKVCDAMAYAHERGVVHRDLKPANIMVGAHGEAYVLDWGVAKVPGVADPELADTDSALQTASDSIDTTQTGAALGTPPYMSPEQALGDPSVGAASDQYALGLMLQEITTLTRANPGKNAASAIFLAQQAERRPFVEPPDLVAVVAKACHPEPRWRYAGVTELARDVRRFLHGQELQARPDNLVRKLWRWTTRNPTATMSVLFGMVLSVAGVVIAALVLLLVQEDRAAREQALVSVRVAEVGRRAHEIDSELIRYKGLVDALAAQAEDLWNAAGHYDDPLYDRAAYRSAPPPDYRPNDRYGMSVSFEHPLVQHPLDKPLGDFESDVHRLSILRHEFREVMLRAADEQAPHWTAAEQHKLLWQTGVPPSWVYVGLEDGVLLNYPGMPRLSDDYDARMRPWYTATRGTHGSRWGHPYQDDSGRSILVPCNRALYDSQGDFFGVVGLDLDLDTMLDLMDVDIDGVVAEWFVDAKGQVVLSSEQRGLNLGAGLHDNRALDQQQFPYAEALRAMAAGHEYGHYPVEDGTVVFTELVSLGWTYAVLFEDG